MRKAFVLESPSVVIPWGIEELGFLELVRRQAKRVTAGHYRFHCKLLGGFEHEVDFHFTPRQSGRLFQVEIHRSPSRHRKRAFDDLQSRLETSLGLGVKSSPVQDDVTPCQWHLGKLTVCHDYHYRYGLYERVLFTHKLV